MNTLNKCKMWMKTPDKTSVIDYIRPPLTTGCYSYFYKFRAFKILKLPCFKKAGWSTNYPPDLP